MSISPDAALPDVGPADSERLYCDLLLPEGPPERPHLAINMVSTVDGKISIGGTAALIGSDLDKRCLQRLRAAADGLMHGAGTVRAERFPPRVPPALVEQRVARGLAPQPRPIVVTRSGDLPLDGPYFMECEPPVIVIAPATLDPAVRTRLAARTELLLTGDAAPDLAAALRALRQQHGLRHVMLEGGPGLNFSLLRAGLVDELFWTLAPKVVGGPADLTLFAGAGFPVGTWATLELLSLYWHDSELFLRYRVQAPLPS